LTKLVRSACNKDQSRDMYRLQLTDLAHVV
jgi:hypothetical protein